jgi:hypothetical protein
MRPPKSKISYGKTVGKEYVYEKSGNFYIGPFYKLNGIFYAGKDYDSNINNEEDRLLYVKQKPIDNPNSFLYNVLAGAKAGLNPISVSKRPTKNAALASIQAANQQGLVPPTTVNVAEENEVLQTNADDVQRSSTPVEVKRYFLRKKIKTKPDEFRFSEINETDYDKLKRALPIINVVAFVTETRIEAIKPEFNTDELDKAEKRMPGLKVFLGIEAEQATA